MFRWCGPGCNEICVDDEVKPKYGEADAQSDEPVVLWLALAHVLSVAPDGAGQEESHKDEASDSGSDRVLRSCELQVVADGYKNEHNFSIFQDYCQSATIAP